MFTSPHARLRGAAAALLTAALVSACGTTTPIVSQRSVDGLSSGDGLTLDGTAPESAPGGGAAAGPGGQPAGGSAGVPQGRGDAPSAPGGTSPVPVAGRGPGTPTAVTTRGGPPVKVGVFVTKDLGPAAEALGADGLATGDGAAQARAAVAMLNTRGGIAGRKVTPVVFEYDATGDQNTQFQAACSRFFDDEKVTAVVSVLLLAPLRQCAAKAGVPFVSSGNRTTSRAELDRHALTALAPQLSLERVVPTWLVSLKQQGWFGTAPTIGLLYNEDSDYAGVPGMVEAQLKRLGLGLTDKQAMPSTDDTSRVGGATSAGQNAALRFSSRGIDHVLTVDKSGQALAYFGLAAANQGYYPTLGLTSLQLPNILRTVLSARALQGARGIGWSPGVDVPIRLQPVVSSNAAACLKAMSDGGEDMGSLGTRFSALSTCEGLLVLAAAWSRGDVSGSGFAQGLRALTTTFAPALTFATDFSRRPDGASRVRPLAFDAGCDCFAYTGPVQEAP